MELQDAQQPPRKFNWFTMFREGFTAMSRLSKILWALVIVKLIVIFLLLKPLFFPNRLNTAFDTDTEKSRHVQTELYERSIKE